MNQITIQDKDKKTMITSLKRLTGQIQNIIKKIEEDKISNETFTQLLAIKGGTSRVCRDLIVKGVLVNLNEYSQEELEKAVDIILRLDR